MPYSSFVWESTADVSKCSLECFLLATNEGRPMSLSRADWHQNKSCCNALATYCTTEYLQSGPHLGTLPHTLLHDRLSQHTARGALLGSYASRSLATYAPVSDNGQY